MSRVTSGKGESHLEGAGQNHAGDAVFATLARRAFLACLAIS